MVEYILYERDKNGYNSNWIDSIDVHKTTVSQEDIIKFSKIIIERNNLSFNEYNIDIIKGRPSQVQSGDFYEFCIGYANINHTPNGIIITESKY